MIMNNRKAHREQDQWEGQVNYLKLKLYWITHQLLLNTLIGDTFYKILILIEAFQMMYYSLYPKFDFLYSVEVFTYIQTFLIKDKHLKLLYFILQRVDIDKAFGVQLVVLLILISTFFLEKYKLFFNYSLRLLSYYGILLNLIFIIPITNLYFSIIYCNLQFEILTTYTCYQQVYFVHFAFSIFGLIIHCGHLIFFITLYVDLDPFSHIPFASAQQQTIAVKQSIKFILPIYTVFDQNAKIGIIFIIILTIAYLFLLYKRYSQPKYYHVWINRVVVIEETTLFWITLTCFFTSIINYNSNIENIGLFYMFFGIPFVCSTFFYLLHQKNKNILSLLVKQYEKDTDVETYVLLIVDYVQNIQKPYSAMFLEGKLRIHYKSCDSQECICRKLLGEDIKEGEQKQLWFTFLAQLLDEIKQRFNSSSKIYILYAFLLNEKLGNHFKALTQLMMAEDKKPSIQEEITMFHLKQRIQSKLIDMEQRIHEDKGIDVYGILNFQNTFIIFLKTIEKTVDYHIEYWKELLEQNPDIQKLKNFGGKITETLDKTTLLYQKLLQQNSNHIKFLTIYGNFLKEIVNDEEESLRLLERVQLLIKQFQINNALDQIRLKYGENANTCIITCSSNFNDIGTVTNCNNEITRLLQFNKNDIVGSNISCIMPKIYAEFHDQYMISYIETSIPKVMDIERTLCCINSQQYLVPCSLMIKILPNLEEGIKMVGFLQNQHHSTSEDESDYEWHYILVDGYTYTILGITQSCQTLFGIHQSIITTNTFRQKITLDVLIPGIKENQLNLNDEIDAQLETTHLQEYYLQGIGDSQSEISNYEDEDQFCEFPNDPLKNSSDSRIKQLILNPDKNKKNDQITDVYSPGGFFNRVQTVEIRKRGTEKLQRYKSYKIKIILTSEIKMGDLLVQTIKFCQLPDEDIQNNDENNKKPDKIHLPINQIQIQHQKYDPIVEDCNSSYSSVTERNNKELKEFKFMISSKTEPRSIRLLKRAFWFIMLILVLLSSLIIAYRMIQNNDMQEGITAISNGFYRHNLLAEVAFTSRKLQLIQNLTLQSNYSFSIVQTNLSFWINQLQQLQYQLVDIRLQMEEKQGSKIQPLYYNTTFLLSTGNTKQQQTYFDDAMMYFITSSTQLISSTNYSFLESSNISVYKDFYYVMINGYYNLREGSTNIANSFYNFYSNLIQDYFTKFLIIMIIGIVFLVLSFFILMPIVSQVHTTNNKVLSLFGMMPIIELKELVEKAEDFLKYLLKDNQEGEQHKITKIPDPIQTQANIIQTSPQSDQPLLGRDTKQESNEEDSRQNQKQQKISSNQTSDGQTQQLPQGISQGQTKFDQRQNSKNTIKEEKQEDDDERSYHLLVSKGNHNCIIAIQFIIFFLLFISYFIIDIILEQIFLIRAQNIFDHLKSIQERPINIKYYVYLTFEQIITYSDINTNLITQFSELVIENERMISSEISLSHPSQLDEYFSQLADFSYSNICEITFSVNQFTLQPNVCQNVQYGLLSQGLRTTIASIQLNANDMIKQWNLSEKTTNDFSTIMQNYLVQIDQINNYIQNTCYYLNQQYILELSTYLDYTQKVESIKFSVFIIFVTFVFIFCMTKYQKDLSLQIWQTKGLLNMIPLEIIARYQHLRKQFLEGKILKAVS